MIIYSEPDTTALGASFFGRGNEGHIEIWYGVAERRKNRQPEAFVGTIVIKAVVLIEGNLKIVNCNDTRGMVFENDLDFARQWQIDTPMRVEIKEGSRLSDTV